MSGIVQGSLSFAGPAELRPLVEALVPLGKAVDAWIAAVVAAMPAMDRAMSLAGANLADWLATDSGQRWLADLGKFRLLAAAE